MNRFTKHSSLILIQSALILSSVSCGGESPGKKAASTQSGLVEASPWTSWYQRPFALAALELANLRNNLLSHNLFDSYPEGKRPLELVKCSYNEKFVRTADGTCNDLNDPGMGAAGTRFGRNVKLASVTNETAEELITPNPRDISRELLTRDTFKEVPFLNLLAASWIQFETHDWFSHGDVQYTGLVDVPLAKEDPFRSKYKIDTLFVPSTAEDFSRDAADEGLPKTYLNEVTHWWDGSQIYGSSVKVTASLRSFENGLLKTTDGKIPLNSSGIDDTGFSRNWWVGLSLLHNLFVLEHNAIAARLKGYYPDWDDEKLFQKARLINAAVLAKIHTVEWTPAILPNPTLAKGMHSNWFGLTSNGQTTIDPAIAIFNGKDPALFGIVGNPRNLYDVPFSLTEEFVSVYRMHSLLPDTLAIKDLKSGATLDRVGLENTRNESAANLINLYNLDNLFYSFGTAHPGALVLNNFPKFMQDLKIPGLGAFDMGTVDIIRDRERGVPRYNEFRRQLQLKPITRFAQLTDDAEAVKKLEKLYGGDVEKLDLVIGCLAEAHRPKFFGFGETAFQVFIIMASRRLMADRFFTDSYNEETYSKVGLDWIDNATMKNVLLRHFPALAKTGLSKVDNAFTPW